jgi:hypothetical protein
VLGSVEIAPEKDGAFRVTLATSTSYGPDDEQQQTCQADALVRPGPDGWLVGKAEADKSDAAPSDDKKTTQQPGLLKIRLQGETLRVVAGDESRDDIDSEGFNCSGVNQLTGSYFSSGKTPEAKEQAAASSFAAPSFDCAKVSTADEEEICADPDLTANDHRLNRAWQQLLPRLDAATRKFLTEDQRGYVVSQATQYPEFLHPAWEKRNYYMHHTALGRDMLYRLQLERVAVLEGFEAPGLFGRLDGARRIDGGEARRRRHTECHGPQMVPGRLEGRMRI